MYFALTVTANRQIDHTDSDVFRNSCIGLVLWAWM